MEKQVGYRVQTILSSPPLLAVFKRFGASVFRRSSVFHGLGQFLEEQKVRGNRCFEIGTWNGLTAVVLSRFFEEVVTIDIVSNPEKHEIISHLGIKNIRCIDIADNKEKKGVFSDFEFDFAYLDGDHTNDTDSDFEVVRSCGRVLFHEVWPFQPRVWNLIHTLPHWQIAFGGSGLALWDASKESDRA